MTWGSQYSVWHQTERLGFDPGRAKDFSSSLYVLTSSEAHPAFYSRGTGGPFPGSRALRDRDADHSPLSTVEVRNE
jgi:hypothetical protein